MGEIAEIHISPRQRDLSLISNKVDAERPPDGVLETFPNEQKIRCAEPVVVVAGEVTAAVNVRTTQSGLEVERHHAARIGNGFGKQHSYADCTLPIDGIGDGRTLAARSSGALVRAVECSGTRRSLSVQGKYVSEIRGPAAETIR